MSSIRDYKLQGTVKTYIWGFLLSVILTLAAFFAVDQKLLTGPSLIYTIVGLGLVQTVIQLVLFLHLGEESKPRWNMLAFFFMLTVLVVIVFGSLWIMYHLNYRMMPMMDMQHQ
ncbi:MAG: cytochrome o ubiquinol oxidase subunit IV [Chlamydiales bacterium]|nr:cytochrome o ubiquinol oxidase subunit IV [Chlamydiales bacterium]